MSDGSFLSPLNSFKKHQQRLARYQRRMRRKVKFSHNWKKARAKVQPHPTPKSADAKKDYLHKATTTISQNHALVCIEDLQVRKMSRSTKRQSRHSLGKMVPPRSPHCNCSILDPGGGVSSGGNWITSCCGTAACCSPFLRTIPVALARAAAMCRKTTGPPRQDFCASIVAMKITPMSSARSMF